jgi:hypothetical protein
LPSDGQLTATLKRIWRVRQANRASIGLWHFGTLLALFGVYAVTRWDPYKIVLGGGIVYGLLSLWALVAPANRVRLLTRHSFLLWIVGVQSVVAVLVGLIGENPWQLLALLSINVPLSFLALGRLTK